MKGNPFGELIGEVIGAIVLGFIGIIFILVLATLGEATGQNEIVSQAISAILILIGGFGIPIGIIWLIKFLGENLNGGY
jgi:hypothetical protein